MELMNGFCTIITKSHLPYAVGIYESLKAYSPKINLEVFVVDSDMAQRNYKNYEGFNILDINTLCEEGVAKTIFEKYFSSNMDKFRWSMKPVLMKHLLTNGFEKMLYVDSDICFFKDPMFLFQKLDTSSVLLTPHWKTTKIWENYKDFVRNHRHGMYNAGFVGSNQKGIEALDWWAKSCESVCVKKMSDGLYVDQSYLDLFPVLFSNVESIKHRGCNVANWNQRDCVRGLNSDQEVVINNEYPIVFIHMTGDTMRGALDGEDPLLRSFVEQYSANIEKLDPSINLVEKFSKPKKLFGLF